MLHTLIIFSILEKARHETKKARDAEKQAAKGCFINWVQKLLINLSIQNIEKAQEAREEAERKAQEAQDANNKADKGKWKLKFVQIV